MDELIDFSKIIKLSAQNRHIKGTAEYEDGNSYLSEDENPQMLLDELSGMGSLRIERNGLKEIVRANRIIGIAVTSKGEYPTHEAKIHYSKGGAHIVPRREAK